MDPFCSTTPVCITIRAADRRSYEAVLEIVLELVLEVQATPKSIFSLT